MEIIAHRINTIKELVNLPSRFGVEIDLRDSLNGNIYLSHDPFIVGEDFEKYLKNYRHGTMILNIKSERIELKCIELLKKYNIHKYFFLDSSFPMIFLLSKHSVKNVALRLSEYEGMDTIRNMAGKVDWVWVDCFTKIPIGENDYKELKSLGYKLCLVSPELEGREEDIEKYKKYIFDNHIKFDAVCTQNSNITRWSS